EGQGKVPAEVEADGQPQVAAAEERIAEQDAKTRGVGDAEPGGVGVGGVQQGEEDAHGQDGGVGSTAGQQKLKTIAAEEQLLAGGAGASTRRAEPAPPIRPNRRLSAEARLSHRPASPMGRSS